MKSELDLVREFKELFETNHDIASNILIAGQPSPININFYSRQKEWCSKYLAKFTKVFDELKEEKLKDRMLRALGSEENVERINRIIFILEKHRDNIIKRRLAEEEAKLKAAEAKLKAEEAKLKAEELKKEEKVKKLS